MKVLLINGSPDGKGCIHTALTLAAEVLNKEGIETEEIHVGNKDIRGCIACRKCKQTGKCVFSDLVNEVSPKLAEADGIVIGSPVYYGMPNGTVLSFMQRLFYSCGCDLHMKVGHGHGRDGARGAGEHPLRAADQVHDRARAAAVNCLPVRILNRATD